MTIITIDGNIGSGKTSVLTYLHKVHKYSIDLEPIESWNAYLEKLYNDKNDVFNFQVRIWLDRCWIQEKTEKMIILMERSPYFIQNTFIELAYKDKMLTDTEHNMLLDLHQKTNNLWKCNTYIYLRSDPENCIKRIKKRGRQSEQNISSKYIRDLHEFHEKTYENAKKQNMNIVVIDVDNKNINEIANEILEKIV